MSAAQGSALPTVWRTKLRSTVPGIDHASQVQHCLDCNLIGIGWRIDDLPADASLAFTVDWIENESADGWGRRAAQTVRRFGEAAKAGDFVWTRDTHGRYLLCRIAGGWRYDGSQAARNVDVHQVRDAHWAPRPLNDLEVPGGVIRCFVGIGSSFSRIHDEPARRLTAYLWEKLNGRPLPSIGLTRSEILAHHLDPYDVEDLIYVWLQAERNYLALPRARQRDTPAYEWTMVHRDGTHRAIVQVKTGETPVDLPALASAAADARTKTYAFATSGKYLGSPGLVTELIESEALIAFASRTPKLLPPRVAGWFEMAN